MALSRYKGSCDGAAETFKRIAARSSLQNSPESQITTPQKLYECESQSGIFPSVKIEFSSVYHRVTKKQKNLKKCTAYT